MIDSLRAAPGASWRDWLALTKPKVVSLLLFTSIAAMCMAARGLPEWLPLAGVLLGGAMCSGGAGVFNMLLERDIDARMKRTAGRPLVTGVITPRQAIGFGSALSVGALIILWLFALLHLQVELVQRAHFLAAGAVDFRQVTSFDDSHGISASPVNNLFHYITGGDNPSCDGRAARATIGP